MNNPLSSDTRDGMSQAERQLAALIPENLRIDQRDIPELLYFLSELSGQLNYYDADDLPAGDWKSLFRSDINILTAVLSRLDSSQHSGVIDELDGWILQAGKEEAPRNSLVNILEVTDKTLDLLTGLTLHLNLAGDNIAISRELSSIAGISREALEKLRSPIVTALSRNNKDLKEEMHTLLPQIALIFSAIKANHNYLLTTVGYFLKNNPLMEQSYNPHLGLLLTFLHLYTDLQANLNTLTRKHLGFYYKEILGIRPRAAIPGHVHLFFEPGAHISNILLRAGSELQAEVAGQEKPLLYRLREDLLVTPSTIKELKTIYISDDPIFSRSPDDKEVTEAQVFKGDYSCPDPKLLLKAGAPQDPWPVMGEEQHTLPDKDRTMDDTAIGLLIGSPLLYLTEGVRQVRIEFFFTTASFRDFSGFIASFALLAEKKESTVLIELLSGAFVIGYTAIDGWERVKTYQVRVTENNGLEVSFLLSRTAKAISLYKEQLHKQGTRKALPYVRLLVNNDVSHNAFGFFRKLLVERIHITASVKDFGGLRLQNNTGPLGPGSPFQLFGPQPLPGAYLDIRNTNVFNRYTTGLTIRLEWMGLPKNPSGFESYYEGYPGEIRNRSFLVGLSALPRARSGMQRNDAQKFRLFNTYEQDQVVYLSDTTLIMNIDLAKLDFQEGPLLAKEITDQDPVFKHGAVRLELMAPDEGFGHRLFPKIFPEIIRHNAGKFNKKLPLPNQPFIPVLKSIWIDYTLESSDVLAVSGSEEQEKRLDLVHQYPFGNDQLYPGNSRSIYSFMPVLDHNNNLFIGISDIQGGQPLSIFFQLEEKKFHHSAHFPEPVCWSYLKDNRWVEMDPKEVIWDSTNNFINSGIVRLTIPAGISKGNTILNPLLYWLRAANKAGGHPISKVVAIFAHGASAERVPLPGEKIPEAFRLPPGSIKDLKQRVPGIQHAWQLFHSQGGRIAEEEDQYYIRVSERLRHKHRPLTTRDIEQVVLNAFPDIQVAKCFGIGNWDRMILPGVNVQVVVIPGEKQSGQFSNDQPQASLATLYAIKDFLSGILSPFARLEVGNPVYEKVKLICTIRFRDTGLHDEGNSLIRLHEDIRKYLCPWLYGNSRDLIIGGRIYLSDILNYIRNLPYISYVTGFSVIHFFMVQDIDTGKYVAKVIDSAVDPIEYVRGSMPGAILIPAEHHLVTVADTAGYKAPAPSGISGFSIGDELLGAAPREKERIADKAPEEDLPGSQERFSLIIYPTI